MVVAIAGAAIVLLYALVLVGLGLDGTERRDAISWLRNRRGVARGAGIDEIEQLIAPVESVLPPFGEVTAAERGNDSEP